MLWNNETGENWRKIVIQGHGAAMSLCIALRLRGLQLHLLENDIQQDVLLRGLAQG